MSFHVGLRLAGSSAGRPRESACRAIIVHRTQKRQQHGMNEALEVRWDTAGKMGWELMVHVNDGGPLLVASIPRTLIEEASPDLAGDILHRATAIRDQVEAAIASAYAHERFSTVYEAGSAFVMHRGLTVTAADF